MPKPAFFRRMGADDRRELDNEIRRRAYSDCVGLCSWLGARGVLIHKSSLGVYIKALKTADSQAAVTDPLLDASNAAAAALASLQADPLHHGFPAAARRQLQDALADVIQGVHRRRIAHEASPA